jgi:cob(I)alamin adenosyltransferase
MPIYTKFGDKGKTSLFAGKIVSKASLRVNTYGTLDELNSFLGIVIADLKDKKLKSKLLVVQNDLFEIGASLANPSSKKHKHLEKYLGERVIEFEQEIDGLTKVLPEIKNFILPGGSKIGSGLHFARTLVRRAERRVVELAEKEKINAQVMIYMNRLSDLLFMYARSINYKEKKKEIIWSSKH